MLLLPTIIGPVTLQRKLGTGSIAETYQGLHGGFRGRQVVVRRVLPWVVRDPRRKAELEARVRFLLRLRHPLLSGNRQSGSAYLIYAISFSG